LGKRNCGSRKIEGEIMEPKEILYYTINNYEDYLLFQHGAKEGAPFAWTEEKFNEEIRDNTKIGLPCIAWMEGAGERWGYLKLTKLNNLNVEEGLKYLTISEDKFREGLEIFAKEINESSLRAAKLADEYILNIKNARQIEKAV
jgi:hypothetical protein